MATKKKKTRKRRKPSEMYNGFSPELMDSILKDGGYDELASGDLANRLIGGLIKRAMDAEMTEHLDYEHGEAPPEHESNRRNGKRAKTLRSDHGPMKVDVPRDREGTFEPKIVPKHQREWKGFDDKILSMYALGMTVRDIQRHLEDIYQVEVSKDLISRVTDAVLDEVETWRTRPLESVYPIVIIDALQVKVRDGNVQKKAFYLAIGVTADGERDVLGMWTSTTEGAKQWAQNLESLKKRGVEDILILCADGLTGLPDAVEMVFPKTVFQTCVVHLIRDSTSLVPWNDRKEACKDLRTVYTAVDVREAKQKLKAFAKKWEQYPIIAEKWERRFDEWTTYLAFPDELRRIIYTTNAVEALNRQVRKVIKTRGAFPSTEAAEKLIFLALQNAMKSWSKRVHHWRKVKMVLALHFGERFSV